VEALRKLSQQSGQVAGIGSVVTHRSVSSNVATLTTQAAHGLSADDIVLVRGVHDDYDGYRTVTATPTATTLTYALTLDDEGETAVSPSGAVSSRLFEGKRRIAETENLEETVRALTAETQAVLIWYPIERVSGSNINLEGVFVVGGLLLVRLPRDTTTDLGDVLDLCEAIGAAVNQECMYKGFDQRISYRYTFAEGLQQQHDIVRVELSVELPIRSCQTGG
jgi:hypothetical protein